MAENPETPTQQSEADGREQALFELVHTIAVILKNNAQHLWLSSRDSEEATDGAYLLLKTLVDEESEVSFKLAGDALLVNEVEIRCDETPLDFFLEHLTERGLGDFRMEADMTLADFHQFVDFLNVDPVEIEEEGGCTESARQRGIGHLTVRRIYFKEVAEDEVVVQKEIVHEEGTGEWVDNETLSHIVAFLRGGPGQTDDGIQDKVHEIASDSEKMVELIMRSVDIRQQRVSLEGGETLAEVVVGSLRRAVGILKGHPTTQSQKGRKKLAKTLVMLEKEMLDAIRDVAEAADLETAQEVSAAIDDMSDEIEVESLAGDYMRKRRAVGQSERRLLRYMRAKGVKHADEGHLRARLVEDGLGGGDWQELVVKSGEPRTSPSIPGLDGGLMALGQLARLLSQMEKIVSQAKEKPSSEMADELGKTATTVRNAVKGAIEGTEEKIRELANEIKEEEQAERDQKAGRKTKPRPSAMSRKRMLEILAEIVQELCQPLSVINCSLQMVMSGRLGGVTETQVSMLKLADESAERITMLSDSLRKISVEPEALEPDLDITRSFYSDA